jgi:hypothetical protein
MDKQAMSDAAVDFIKVEFHVCELYSRLAVDADDEVARERCYRTAWKAYEVIVRFLPRLGLEESELQKWQQRLTLVRAELGKRGR